MNDKISPCGRNDRRFVKKDRGFISGFAADKTHYPHKASVISSEARNLLFAMTL